MNFIGIVTGKLLTDLGIAIPEYYWTMCMFSAVLLCSFYPSRKPSTPRSASLNYVRRKSFDLLLCLVTFIMIVYAGNHWKNLFLNAPSVHATAIVPPPKDSLIINHPIIKNFLLKINSAEVAQMNHKEKMRMVKKQIRTVKANKEISQSIRILLITLIVLLAMFLFVGIASLSCSLSCSGNEALALVVGFGGTLLLCILTIRLIRYINRKSEKEKSETEVKK